MKKFFYIYLFLNINFIFSILSPIEVEKNTLFLKRNFISCTNLLSNYQYFDQLYFRYEDTNDSQIIWSYVVANPSGLLIVTSIWDDDSNKWIEMQQVKGCDRRRDGKLNFLAFKKVKTKSGARSFVSIPKFEVVTINASIEKILFYYTKKKDVTESGATPLVDKETISVDLLTPENIMTNLYRLTINECKSLIGFYNKFDKFYISYEVKDKEPIWSYVYKFKQVTSALTRTNKLYMFNREWDSTKNAWLPLGQVGSSCIDSILPGENKFSLDTLSRPLKIVGINDFLHLDYYSSKVININFEQIKFYVSYKNMYDPSETSLLTDYSTSREVKKSQVEEDKDE